MCSLSGRAYELSCHLHPVLYSKHAGKVGWIDPTGCQVAIRGFLLAAELGSTRIRGNYLSSGIAGVNGGKSI